MNAVTMTPASAQFDSAQTQWAMPHSPYANANYSPYANANYTTVENHMRHGTGTSGSGSDGQDIIPGGEFDEPDLQQHRGLKKSYTSSRGFVRPNDIMTFPQTPHRRSLSNYQGMSESIGKDAYRNVSYSTPDHHNRSGGSDSAMDIIEQTKRMNMLPTPAQYLSSSSPTSMSTMQPSAFRLEGVPMTPDRTSNFGYCEIGNGYAQPQAVSFPPSQPQSMQFVPGPPQHMRVEHAGSALSLVNSFNGQLDGPFIPQSLRASFVPSTGLPLSTSARSDLTVATSGGFPSTPTDPGTFGFQDSNSFAFHVKTEPGEATPAVESDIFQQQHGGNHYQTTMYSSPGQFNSSDNRRHHHPYHLAQTEPINRIATTPVASNDSPATPSVFAFNRPLQAMASSNSSPTPITRGPAVSGTANPSTINGRHQHSGSLQFPMTSSRTPYEGNGAAARQPYLQSMSLPNRGMTRLPVSPGGESLRSEGDSEFDDEWSGAAGQPRPPRAIQMYGSPRHGSSNSPRLPKNHICHLCGKAFNRPSSLNTHMAVHTGAKPFQCPKRDCGRKFSVSSNLRRHMKTHTVNEQARVAQLTARDLAAQSHFEVDPDVKLEPEDHPADDILEEEERELENGSIVYDDNGRAYRYYTSESAFQEATAGNLAETPTQERANQWTGQQQQHQTSPGSLSIDEVYNQDSPFVSMQLQSSLGNAAPVSFSPSITAESRNGTHQELAAPFEQWMPGNPALHISPGVSLQQPLMLGNAGASGN